MHEGKLAEASLKPGWGQAMRYREPRGTPLGSRVLPSLPQPLVEGWFPFGGIYASVVDVIKELVFLIDY